MTRAVVPSEVGDPHTRRNNASARRAPFSFTLLVRYLLNFSPRRRTTYENFPRRQGCNAVPSVPGMEIPPTRPPLENPPSFAFFKVVRVVFTNARPNCTFRLARIFTLNKPVHPSNYLLGKRTTCLLGSRHLSPLLRTRPWKCEKGTCRPLIIMATRNLN